MVRVVDTRYASPTLTCRVTTPVPSASQSVLVDYLAKGMWTFWFDEELPCSDFIALAAQHPRLEAPKTSLDCLPYFPMSRIWSAFSLPWLVRISRSFPYLSSRYGLYVTGKVAKHWRLDHIYVPFVTAAGVSFVMC